MAKKQKSQPRAAASRIGLAWPAATMKFEMRAESCTAVSRSGEEGRQESGHQQKEG
jgi:hypothetical protein